MSAYGSLILLLRQLGLSEDEGATFIRKLVREFAASDSEDIDRQLEEITQRLHNWFDRQESERKKESIKLIGAVAGGVGIGVAGNFVSDLIKGDNWFAPAATHGSKTPEETTRKILILAEFSRAKFDGPLRQFSEIHRSRGYSEAASQILQLSVLSRDIFDRLEAPRWPSPGRVLALKVPEYVARKVTEGARYRNVRRGIHCADLLQASLESMRPSLGF